MSGGRWYPTGTVLEDGKVMVLSGFLDTPSTTDTSTINSTVQIGNGTTWTAAGTFSSVWIYPREHLLPDGKVFEDGANPDSQMFDPLAHTWKTVATTIFGQNRYYGTSVLLPLTLANGFKPKVMIMGGAPPSATDPTKLSAATDTTELIDLSVASPKWVSGPNMVGARVELNATILPSGAVLVSGGSSQDEDPATAIVQAQLYHPESNTFTSASTMEYPRLYHSNTLLLPDGTVLALGSNPQRGEWEGHMEIYSPPYLFKSDGSPAKRPVITKVTPAAVSYGATFSVSTAQAAGIVSVVLIRPGAVTHAFDMEQRLVGLSFRKVAGTLRVKAPANGKLAPPGYYLVFIVDDAGVPSVAQFIHLGAPTDTIPIKP